MIKSPEKLATNTTLSPEQPSNKLGSFFIGFGDRTRRELKAGLHLGERLARHAGDSGLCNLHKENSPTSDHLSLKSPLDLPVPTLPDEENTESSIASYFQTTSNFTHAAHPGVSSDPLSGKSTAASDDVFECPPLVQVQSPSYPRLPTPDTTQESYALGVPPSLTQAEYPTLNTKQQQTHLSPARSERSVDAMSWRASSPPVYIRNDHETVKEQTVHVDSPDLPYPFDKIGRRQRRAVLNELNAMSPSKIVVIDSDDETIQFKVEEAGEDDVWQQGALKTSPIASSPPSTQRAAHQDEDEPVQRQPQLEDLFAHGGPPIPRRGKLPRTWRRVSANDFHYSDSPEPEEVPQRKLLSRHTSSGSQTLTPPSTEDEEDPEEEEVSQVEQDDTELQEDDREGATSADESNTTSPDDAEDTGIFWQSNLPTVFSRPRREGPQLRNRNLDLTTLLGLHDNSTNALRSSPVRSCAPSGPFQDAPRLAPAAPPAASPLRMRPLEGTFKHSPSKSSAAISTPLRNSLLRSSKVRSSPTYTKQAKSSPLQKAASRTDVGGEEEEILEDAEDGGGSERGMYEGESFEQDSINQSMASDTRQLYAEMNQHQQFDIKKPDEMEELVQNPGGRYETQEITITHRLSIETTQYHGTNFSELDDDGDDSVGDLPDSDEMEEEDDITEHASSPQQQIKIPVKFNDSSDLHAASTGDPLAPKKSYPSLFGTIPSSKTHSEPTRSASIAAPPPAPTGGIFSRLSSTFWSAVTSTSTSATTTTDTTRSATRPAPTSPAGNTAALRAKYGTLTCYAPWTIAHYRILHRMYRATVRQPLYFAPPSAGGTSRPQLRKELKVLLGRECCTPHFTSTWTLPDIYLIDAFVSLLVEPGAHNARGLWLMDEVLPPGPEGKKGSEKALGGGGGLAEDGMRLREWDVAVRLHSVVYGEQLRGYTIR
ncbi:hypothetical protein LTR04_001070 [Oleoguttula sp. CCFEE 6159]|nr:hypothetical protein LTR04_001070 [Oleoguttula sp. CCFEE 6159]